MKRFAVLLSLFAMISSLLTACTVLVPQPAAPVTITFYKRGYVEGGTDATSVTNAKAVAAFQKTHPAITVKIVGIPWTTEGTTQLEAALASGTDINVLTLGQADVARFARLGKISDIEPFLTAQDKADFYTSGFQSALVDGKVYAYPLWVTALGIYANTDLFKERGVALPSLDKPWTWDEFVAAAQKLTFKRADGTQVYGFTSASKPGVMGYQALWYVDGGRVLSPDGRRFVQNEPEGISALQKIADLALLQKVTPPDFGNVDQAAIHEQFKQGKVATVMDPPAFIAELEKLNAPFTILPAPVGKLGKVVSMGAFGLFCVYNTPDTNKLKAAHEFANYMTGAQVPQDVPGYQLAPSLRRSNASYATTPPRAIIAKLVEYGVYEPPANISPALLSQYDLAMQAILLGKKTPQQAMDEIAPAYQGELDALRK